MIGRNCFRQSEIKEDRVRERQASCKQEWNIDSPTTQDSANCRTEDKSQTESGANQAHSFRAIFLRRDIGDIGLRGRDIAAGDSVYDSSQKQHPEGSGEAENQKANTRAD